MKVYAPELIGQINSKLHENLMDVGASFGRGHNPKLKAPFSNCVINNHKYNLMTKDDRTYTLRGLVHLVNPDTISINGLNAEILVRIHQDLQREFSQDIQLSIQQTGHGDQQHSVLHISFDEAVDFSDDLPGALAKEIAQSMSFFAKPGVRQG